MQWYIKPCLSISWKWFLISPVVHISPLWKHRPEHRGKQRLRSRGKINKQKNNCETWIKYYKYYWTWLWGEQSARIGDKRCKKWSDHAGLSMLSSDTSWGSLMHRVVCFFLNLMIWTGIWRHFPSGFQCAHHHYSGFGHGPWLMKITFKIHLSCGKCLNYICRINVFKLIPRQRKNININHGLI